MQMTNITKIWLMQNYYPSRKEIRLLAGKGLVSSVASTREMRPTLIVHLVPFRSHAILTPSGATRLLPFFAWLFPRWYILSIQVRCIGVIFGLLKAHSGDWETHCITANISSHGEFNSSGVHQCTWHCKKITLQKGDNCIHNFHLGRYIVG